MVKVSIIIPVYNRFQVLQRTLDSVFNQTYKNWEIIIVDDCSKEALILGNLNIDDNLLEKIKLICNDQNLGPGLSRQKGLDTASGEMVCFLDADDYWDSQFLQKSVDVHQANPTVSATYTVVEETWERGKEIRKNSNMSFSAIFPENIKGPCPWQTSCLMWKKKYMGVWTDLRTTQDRVFEFNCAMINNTVKHIPFVLCYVDKTTGENSADLVKYEKSLIHRHLHTEYFWGNLDKITHPVYNREDILLILRKNIIKNTARLMKYKGNDEYIYKGITKAYAGIYSKIVWYLYVLIKINPRAVTILSRFLVKSANGGAIRRI